MNENIKISVILPVYNVERYIPQCLDSIINQTYKNLEIICVDDGSTDNSLEIIKQYAQRDDRIIVISQENLSQGAARNSGLQVATGNYISFVDPDDWLANDAYEVIVEEINKLNPDVLQFEHKLYIEALKEYTNSKLSKEYKRRVNIDIASINSYSFSDIKVKNLLKFQSCCWDKVYKREFLINNNIKFLPHKYGEDIFFNFKLVLCVNKIYFLHRELYYYRKRSYSYENVNNKRDSRFIFEHIENVESLLHEYNLYNKMRREIFNYKLRVVYEEDKKCSDEYKAEFLSLAKEKLTSLEYMCFIVQKYVSILLRNLFSIKKNVYINDANNIVVIILGMKILIKAK